MARYIARIELTGLKEGEDTFKLYDDLHGYLKKIKFERFYEGAASGKRQLPDATYLGMFEGTPAACRDAVVEAATKTGKKPRVVVAEVMAGTVATYGLQPYVEPTSS